MNASFTWVVRIGLIVAVLAIFAQLWRYDYINLDDPMYIFRNEHVEAGLTPGSIRWAMGTDLGYWTPVTLLAYIVDYQLFGRDAGMHHLVNVLFHLLAALLLFAALQRATGALWESAFVAFMFAVHPLHVESVAWIAELKDVLCAFFFFLALYAYVRYTEGPSPGKYAIVVVLYALGLMSKPMSVTFPLALLLFDVWPLRRMEIPKVVWEKVPLFALSVVFSVITYLTQQSLGAMSTIPLGGRVQNAFLSYATYIVEMFWPTRLTLIYPYPNSVPVWQVAGAMVMILGISWIALETRRTRPYILTGWCWYLVMVLPAVGLVAQVGKQPHADRYTYIPMVGLLWILAWGASDVVRQWPRAKGVVLAGAAAACAACSVLAWQQVRYWENAVVLFQHSIDVAGDNEWVRYNMGAAHYLLGTNLMNSGHATEAMAQLEEGLRLRPDMAEAHNNLGLLLQDVPMLSGEAISHFAAAVRLEPKMVLAHRNLGRLLASMPERRAEAMAELEAAQRLQPDEGVQRLLDRLASSK